MRRARARSETPLPSPGPTDPPVPRSFHRRHMLLPLVALLAFWALPVSVAVAVALAGIATRLALHAVTRRRARVTEQRLLDESGPALVLGRDTHGDVVTIPERTLAAHGLILGATGAGKTTTLTTILSQQIRRGRPVIAIDLKGSADFAQELRQAAQTAGRGFVRWTLDGGAYWNPLAAGNATELKDKLLGTERFSEPHYRRAAERYLQLAIQVAHEREPERALTLHRVVELMTPAELAATARELEPKRASQISAYLAALTPDQHSAVRGLASRLAVLSESHTGRFLEPSAGEPGVDMAGIGTQDTGGGAASAHPEMPSLDLRQTLNGGEVVLFSLNSSTYGSLAAMLGTLVVQDLVTAAGARLRDAHAPQATVAIDEFSALGSDNLIALLARGREAGVGVLLATQELADLDRVGRGFKDQVLGDTALKIAHRQDVPASAQTVAQLAGSVRVWEQSYQIRPGGRRAGGLGMDAVSSSARLVERPRIDPQWIQSLATGEAVVIEKSPRVRARVAKVRRQPPAPGVTR